VIRFDNLEVRNSVMNLLKDEWYWVTLHYPPVHKNTYYRNNGYNDLVLKNAEEYYNTCLSLPIFYWLKEEDIKRISSIINKHI